MALSETVYSPTIIEGIPYRVMLSWELMVASIGHQDNGHETKKNFNITETY